MAGFVQHQDLWVTEHRDGQREPLPHSQRVTADTSPSGNGEPNEFEDVIGPLRRKAVDGAVHPQVRTAGTRRMEARSIERSPDHGRGCGKVAVRRAA